MKGPKQFKKVISLLLTMMMVFSMTASVFAADDGSITISKGDHANSVGVQGKTFNAYRVLDAELANGENSENGIVYKVPTGLGDFYAEELGISAPAPGEKGFDEAVVNAIQAHKNDANWIEQFAKNVLAAAKTAGITPETETAGEEEESCVFSGLPLGYYVIEDATQGGGTVISALALTTTDKDAQITVKADQPKIDKKIDEISGDVETNTAAIGDTIPYKVTGKVPDMTGYTKYYYVVTDVLSKGLDFTENSVKIQIGTIELGEDDFTVESSKDDVTGETTVEIAIKDFIQYRTESGAGTDADILITYEAKLNKDAVIGVTGNENKVKLEYSNNPNKEIKPDNDNPDKPGEPIGETPWERTYTYTTGIKLTKIDGDSDTRKVLAGAVFEITGTKLNTVVVNKTEFTEASDGTYFKLKDGTYTTTEPTPETEDYYDGEGKYKKTERKEEIVKAEGVKYEASVDPETGILSFDGLTKGTYEIEEIIAPNGYNILTDKITVTIDYDAPTAITDGNVAENATCTWKVGEGSSNMVNFDAAGIFVMDVENHTGAVLPSTGGIGTTIFYVLGSILLIGAGVLLVTKKKMAGRQ